MRRANFSETVERGVSAHQAGRFDDALACYRAALAMTPNDAEATSLCGLACLHSDRTAEALPLLLRAVELEPNAMGFRLNLAEGLAGDGQYDRALEQLRIVAAAEPGNVRAWERAGDISAQLGDHTAAVSAWSRAHALDLRGVSAALKVARAELMHGRPDAAVKVLDSVAGRAPGHAAIFALRSEALIAQKNWPALHAVVVAWTQAHPASDAAWRAAARAAFEQGQHAEASRAFARAMKLVAPAAADFAAYASLCLHALDIDAATTALDRAEALDPDCTEALASRALLLMYLGRFTDAEAYCRRCLAREPRHASAYTTLSRLRGGRLEDPDLAAVTSIARNADAHPDQRIPAAFAIAHAHDARDDIEAAFAACETAHALALARDAVENRRYDAAAIEHRVQRIVESSAAVPEGATIAAGTPRPVFIVGMPRSGTTLIESVLAAHSRVFGCGERPVMPQILRALLALDAAGRGPDVHTLQAWAAAYFGDLPYIGRAGWVTDKHPLNFEAAGLIARLMQHAVIVHVRRNPMETCLSIWRQEFSKHWTFVHRFEDLGHYYGHYARLVAHWERVLPGRFLTIRYEDFVADFERAAPQLVQACGLAWEPQCLDFQQAQRAITTFSTVQAREPVRSGNGRAQRYGERLAALRASLERAGVDPDSGVLISQGTSGEVP